MTEEIAIIMAAGKGERMRPLTLTTPKPLIPVRGTSMIETVIAGLNRRGVPKIYVVVGYLMEQFSYLTEKYPNVILVENTECDRKNNISSIYAVADRMGKTDCIISEGDLYVSDPSIFDARPACSCGFGKYVAGWTDEWFYRRENGRVLSIGPGGRDGYILGGVTFLRKEDAQTVADAVREAYRHPGHENLFWDDVLSRNLDRVHLEVHPVGADQIVELDSVAELKAFDPGWAARTEL